MAAYHLDLASLTAPALPAEALVDAGTWVTSNDGSANRLSATTFDGDAALTLFDSIGFLDSTWSFTVGFADTAPPASSYIYPSIFTQEHDNEAQIVLSRGTGESRGALWVQYRTSGLIAGTARGTSGVTFARNQKYTVTIVTSGTTDLVYDISVQRLTDGYWLNSSGTWQDTQTIAVNYTFVGARRHIGLLRVNVWQSTQDVFLYAASITQPHDVVACKRTSDSLVIQKGATYDGITADALAAPCVCWDGSRYVANISVWNDSTQKWYGAFFTSPDLKTWTYVVGSLISPQGSDYIACNSGLAWFQGRYYLAFNHYSLENQTVPTTIQWSTDLLTWTVVSTSVTGGYSADPSLSVNPQSGKLELWCMDAGAGWQRNIHLYDSPDGAAWADCGVVMTPPSWCRYNFGEPHAFYLGTTRYMTYDGAVSLGWRFNAFSHSVNQDTTWIEDGIALYRAINAWERNQVFDAFVIVTDNGDGRGTVPHMLYVGSSNNSSTDATASSIGLAYWANVDVKPTKGATTLHGKTSVLSQPNHLAPGGVRAGAVGKSPGATQPNRLAMGATKRVSLTGKSASVAQNIVVFPNGQHALLGGKTATLTQPNRMVLSEAHARLSGRTPLVGAVVVQVSPGRGRAVYAGYSPVLGQANAIVVTEAHLLLTGSAPGLAVGGSSPVVGGEVTLSAASIDALASAIAEAIYNHPNVLTATDLASAVWSKTLP